MDIANDFIIVGSILGVIVIGAMAILPSVWDFEAVRADRPHGRGPGKQDGSAEPGAAPNDPPATRTPPRQESEAASPLRPVPSRAAVGPVRAPAAPRPPLDRAA